MLKSEERREKRSLKEFVVGLQPLYPLSNLCLQYLVVNILWLSCHLRLLGNAYPWSDSKKCNTSLIEVVLISCYCFSLRQSLIALFIIILFICTVSVLQKQYNIKEQFEERIIHNSITLEQLFWFHVFPCIFCPNVYLFFIVVILAHNFSYCLFLMLHTKHNFALLYMCFMNILIAA